MAKEFKITGKHILIAAGIGVGLALAHEYYGFPDNLIIKAKDAFKKVKKPKTMSVRQKEWKKCVKVSRFEEVTETGWEVPNGAYDVRTERRARNSDKIEIGEVSIPLERTDIYYIYKIKKWVHLKTFEKRWAGQYSVEKSVAFDEEIKNRIKASNKSNDVVLSPEIGDCKIYDTSLCFTIYGTDIDDTGKTINADFVDMIFYNDLAIGDLLDYNRVTLDGTVKGLRRHDETATS